MLCPNASTKKICLPVIAVTSPAAEKAFAVNALHIIKSQERCLHVSFLMILSAHMTGQLITL